MQTERSREHSIGTPSTSIKASGQSSAATSKTKNKKKQVLEKIRKDNLKNINTTSYFTSGNLRD